MPELKVEYHPDLRMAFAEWWGELKKETKKTRNRINCVLWNHTENLSLLGKDMKIEEFVKNNKKCIRVTFKPTTEYFKLMEGKMQYKEIVITDPDKKEDTVEIPVTDMLLGSDIYESRIEDPLQTIIKYGDNQYLAYELDSQYHWKIGIYGNKLIAIPLKK